MRKLRGKVGRLYLKTPRGVVSFPPVKHVMTEMVVPTGGDVVKSSLYYYSTKGRVSSRPGGEVRRRSVDLWGVGEGG